MNGLREREDALAAAFEGIPRIQLSCHLSGRFGSLSIVRRLSAEILAICVITGSALAQVALQGTVRDQGGNPVAGARVTLEHEGRGHAQQTSSGAQGEFRFNSVEPGAYKLRIAAPGFYNSEYILTVPARQPVSMAIELVPVASVRQTLEVLQPVCKR